MDRVQIGGPWTRSKEVVHGPGPKRWSIDPVQRGGPWTWGPGFVLSHLPMMDQEKHVSLPESFSDMCFPPQLTVIV